MSWFFGHKACGILAHRPGAEPAPFALEGKVLTTGPPRESLMLIFFNSIFLLTNLFILLYNIALVLPYIDLNLP